MSDVLYCKSYTVKVQKSYQMHQISIKVTDAMFYFITFFLQSN